MGATVSRNTESVALVLLAMVPEMRILQRYLDCGGVGPGDVLAVTGPLVLDGVRRRPIRADDVGDDGPEEEALVCGTKLVWV